MTNENYQVLLLTDRNEIDFDNCVYAGYSPEEVACYERDYQAPFRGELIFEIINAQGDIVYLHCKKGTSFINQVDYMVSPQGILLINANGFLYKFDITTQVNLPIDAFDEVGFENTPSPKGFSMYLQSLASQAFGLMAVVDYKGVALLNYETVLWQYEHDAAYAGYVKPKAITQDHVIIESDDYRFNTTQTIRLDVKTGKEVRY